MTETDTHLIFFSVNPIKKPLCVTHISGTLPMCVKRFLLYLILYLYLSLYLYLYLFLFLVAAVLTMC